MNFKNFMMFVLCMALAVLPCDAEAATVKFYGDGFTASAAMANAQTVAFNRGFPFRISNFVCWNMIDPVYGPFIRCDAFFSSNL